MTTESQRRRRDAAYRRGFEDGRASELHGANGMKPSTFAELRAAIETDKDGQWNALGVLAAAEQLAKLHGPYGWLHGHRALSEDSWTLEDDLLENNEEYFAIPLFALTDPFKEIGKEPSASPHPDDLAVNRFAAAMKAKLGRKRAEGRGGWDNREECSAEHLSYLLIQHCLKGDPLDVGNLAMMLHQRGDRIVIDDETASIMRRPEAKAPETLLADEILAELVRARTKFPGKNVTFAAMVEEVGELATATFEESRDRVRKEAVQVAVMAMRMVLDGDHTFDDWRASKGLDTLTGAAQ